MRSQIAVFTRRRVRVVAFADVFCGRSAVLRLQPRAAMPVIAILPAAALIAGATLGLTVPLPAACWLTLLMLSWIGSVAAFVRRAPNATLALTLLGFATAAAALSQRATREALEPPILAQSAPYRVDIAASASMPLHIEAVIVGDAVATEFGAAFTADVRRVRLPNATAAAAAAPLSGSAATALPPSAKAAPAASAAPAGPPASTVPLALAAQAEPEWHDSGGRVRVTVSGAQARERLMEWRAGRRVRMPVLLNAPLPYRNFGTIDQEQRLALAGIRLFGSVKGATLIDVVASATWWEEASATARGYVRRVISRFVARWDRRSAAIVIAILIGDRAGLDADTESRLQRAGTYHVIAISGGNIAILVTLATTLLRLARASPRLRAALAIAVVVTYATIVGNGASVARATLGAAVYLLAHALDHRSAAINILGVAAAVIIILAPLEVIDPAFWLTCVATLAILVCAERLHAHILNILNTFKNHAPGLTPARVRWIEPAVALFAATIAAESWLLPISAYAFSQMTLAGLALNFAAIPLMAITQIAGLLLLALSAIDVLTPLASIAGYACHLAAFALVESARLTDLIPRAAFRLAPPPLWLVAIAEICGAACWFQRLPQRRLACIAAWTFALTLIALAPPWPASPAAVSALTALHAAGRPPCPQPRVPAPAPGVPTPAPGVPAPAPGVPALAPGVPALAPGVPAPTPGVPAPAPGVPTPAPDAWPAVAETGASAWPAAAARASAADEWLRITTLDVAQGDATLIRFPNGDTLMVDAGGTLTGTYDLGARIVSPALWALGLRRIQTLALTHGDRDHIGGASAVLGDFSVREVWEGIAVSGHPLLTALQRQAWSQGALWRATRRDDQRTLAAAAGATAAASASAALHLRVWNPPTPEWERRRVRNDDSIVLEITYGRVSIILPGDIGPDVERELAPALAQAKAAPQSPERPESPGRPEWPTLRILKAPHHGSARSSTTAFLNAIAPSIAIISAGRGNHFGHPAAAALHRYQLQHAEIFRTDEDGAIQLDTNGRDVHITTCTGRTMHMSAPAP
jgi:competence protein ComEC